MHASPAALLPTSQAMLHANHLSGSLHVFAHCTMMQVEGSVHELYTFMETANATLDESLEEDEEPLSAMASLRAASLPPSVKATPRGLPSGEVSNCCCARLHCAVHLLFWALLRLLANCGQLCSHILCACSRCMVALHCAPIHAACPPLHPPAECAGEWHEPR